MKESNWMGDFCWEQKLALDGTEVIGYCNTIARVAPVCIQVLEEAKLNRLWLTWLRLESV